jgi:KaiC/GvpD/RAD55 family RecA-like ATPase
METITAARADKDAPTVDSAIGLANPGFRVFPLLRFSKRPAEAGWPDSASNDHDAIRAVWRRAGEGCNIGVLCGPGALADGDGLVVVDADLHKPGAAAALAELEACGALPRTRAVSTPRGGKHFYFRTAPGLRIANGADCLGKGIDVRGEHGYVVGPGSYVIDLEKGFAGAYSVIDAAPLARAPPALLSRLSAAPERRRDADDAPACEPDLPDNIEAARQYLRRDARPAIEGEHGNVRTYTIACQARAYGLSEMATLELMREEYNPRCVPPWDDEGLETIVANAHRYAKDPLGYDAPQVVCARLCAGWDASTALPPETASLRLLTAGGVAPSPPRRFPLLNMDAVRQQLVSDYLLKGLLPKTGLVVIWGAPKVGKTFVIVDMLMHVAFGWPYRGRRVKQGVVVYCALEGVAGFSKRLAAFHQAKIAALGQPVDTAAFKIMAQPLSLVAEQKNFVEALASQLGEGNPPAVVVIDTLNRSFEGSESEDKAMTAYVRAATAIIDRFGCAVVIVHHCGLKEDRMRGHTALKGALDVELQIERDSAGSIVTRVAVAKDMAKGAEIVSRLQVVTVGLDEDGDPIESCIVEPADAATGDAEGVRTVMDCFAELLAADAVAAPGGGVLGVAEKALRDRFKAAWRSTRGASDDTAAKAYRRAKERLEREGRLAFLLGGVVVEPQHEGRAAGVSF